MDNQIKSGDEIWVRCMAVLVPDGGTCIRARTYLGESFWVDNKDCKPVDPKVVEQVSTKSR
jgi:hypothetical protein